MVRFGPPDGPQVVVVLPLFEEANRTRAFAGTICRELAVLGIGSILAELPGQGESETATIDASLHDLREALAAVPATHLAAIRSGALLVDDRPAWRLAPQDGPTLVRELTRIKGGALTGERVEVGGNLLTAALVDALSSTSLPGESRGPVPRAELDPGFRSGGGSTRTVRLTTDPRPADRHVAGEPLWRRAEPGNDPALAATLAADIADWIAACDA